MEQLLFGAAYYEEYMPQERLERDMEMMEKAGINVIRIAESTWASQEPQEGRFDFSHVTRVIEAAARHGIGVIVGTPTYAIPPWLAAAHPEVLAVTEQGPGKYGPRQNMDITSPVYRFYAQRIIRRLLAQVRDYPNVIGYQLDNETKHYHTAGPQVMEAFRAHLKARFGTVEELNRAFGFAYWSNAVDCWEHLPDVTGTINGSYAAAFEQFRRSLAADFLLWQRRIVDEYRRPDQFVTHNFDFEWRGYSFGLQPEINPFQAARAVTVAGCDIYHESQDRLTGKEAAFCGAIARALKGDNYLVLETQAQGLPEWTPYDGQLRQQAFSHLANGADGVEYWHWHSIHNSIETYWKGLLSHDLAENRVYREACTIGRDLRAVGDRLLHLKKRCAAAILLSNESLTALEKSPMYHMPGGQVGYNDIARRYADALYELNVEYDVVSCDRRDFSQYALVVVPALYSAQEELLAALADYAAQGGCLVVSFKSGFADEHLQVYHDTQPHMLTDCLGIRYQEWTVPRDTYLRETDAFLEGYTAGLSRQERAVTVWMELVEARGAQVLSAYDHPAWGRYAAVTRNAWGKGRAYYVGCWLSAAYTAALLRGITQELGLRREHTPRFPISVKTGVNAQGRRVCYYFNYSSRPQSLDYPGAAGESLLTGTRIAPGQTLELPPWGVCIVEEA